MGAILAHVAHFFAALGGLGLLLLGVLDSSFLFVPLGNDILVTALVSEHHERMPYYVLMATAGSVLGCFFTDWVSRKGGEEGLKRAVSGRRLQYVERRVRKHAGFALATAALMPPPFPFTVFVIAAAALQYPRIKLLSTIAAGRAVRFTAEGVLAVVYGKQILKLAENSYVQGAMIALIVVSVLGSFWSLYSLFRRSPRAR